MFAISLSFLLLAGCGTSANKEDNTDTAKKNAVETNKKTAQLEAREKAENQIINAQGLIQQNKFDEAQKILEGLLVSTKGKTELAKENKQAEKLLDQIKAQQNNQSSTASQNSSDITKPSTEATTHKPSSEEFMYKSFKNSRFGFTVQYPDTFTVGPEPTNNDGRQFNNGECEIVAYGSFVVDGDTIQRDYEQAISDAKASIAYQKLGDNWFVISYKDVNNIVYEKAIIQDGVSYNLKITYPSSRQAKYGSMVTHIVNSFAPGHGEE
ncbi:hypothetical protein RCG17_06740 [Neobacillus sp. PS3-12]|uniref:hypothetical protein n=1 Tax=Neobacillus sp. PS3-12 TaxID=3070677 RepID=UPI0027E185CE|nr:hypothetical protein [Neobacillus sp. PS3-12]WML54338.1 hypothetical protein RCG17_06740 [Neobacillus sp. PS3-12]